MRAVEIAYRYEAKNPTVRPRPADADAALVRLEDGNRAFAELLNSVKGDGSPVRRVVQVDLAGFEMLGEAMVNSSRIKALLAAEPETSR